MRILRDHQQEKGRDGNIEGCLDWAFAGRSHTKSTGRGNVSHTIWDHWIDSKSDTPDPDEGDMTPQDDGTVLEEGTNVNATTGAESKYEELWRDLPVDQIGKKQNRSSVVLKIDDTENGVKGMIVKTGSWCQGIMKNGGNLTVERWQRKSQEASKEGPTEVDEHEIRTRNDWVKVFKVGEAVLPCGQICQNTQGRLGLNSRIKAILRGGYFEEPTDGSWEMGGSINRDDLEWKVIEEYYW